MVAEPQNQTLWDEVNASLKAGLTSGTITYDGLEDILPQVGLSGDLLNASFNRIDGTDGFKDRPALSEDEVSRARNNGDAPLTALAANIASGDIQRIRDQDFWLDPLFAEDTIDTSEAHRYAADVRSKAPSSVPALTLGADGNTDGKPDESTNVIYDKSLETNTLVSVIGDKDKSPGQRLQAAYALYQKGETSFTVDDHGTPLTVSISADSSGMISLWSPGFSGPLMRGVVKDGVTSQQGECWLLRNEMGCKPPGQHLFITELKF